MPSHRHRFILAAAASAACIAALPIAHAASAPAALAEGYARQSGGANAAQGRAFFMSRHGREWSCSTCHTDAPVREGRHASTGKTISPLAPAANAARFTDEAKVEKWFRRNCNDVAGRECTPAEKANVMAWLLTLKP